MQRPSISPIATVTVLAAAIAISVVLALQSGDAGRVSVVEARVVADADLPGAARIFLTLVNDGGDDRLIGMRLPVAEQVGLEDKDATPQRDLVLPSQSTITLDSQHLHIVARGVDWAAIQPDDETIALSLLFEHSEGITVPITIEATPVPLD